MYRGEPYHTAKKNRPDKSHRGDLLIFSTGIFYFFSDDNQRVYPQQSVPTWDLPHFTLTRNLRNTKSIYQCANRFYKGFSIHGAGPDGTEIEFIEAASEVERSEHLAEILGRLIDDEDVAARDIAVLTGKSPKVSTLWKNAKLARFKWKQNEFGPKDQLLFESILRFKGLERQIVILTEIDHLTNGDKDELLYVGLSRARVHLAVMGTRETLAYVRSDETRLKLSRDSSEVPNDDLVQRADQLWVGQLSTDGDTLVYDATCQSEDFDKVRFFSLKEQDWRTFDRTKARQLVRSHPNVKEATEAESVYRMISPTLKP